MSSRPLLKPHYVVTNGDMSGDITSDVTIIQQLSMASYTYIWSGTSPVGTVKVQVSNDYAIDAGGVVTNSGNWTTIALTDDTGSTVLALDVTGNTGTNAIDLSKISFYAVRTIYTRTSGTGTLQVIISGKAA